MEYEDHAGVVTGAGSGIGRALSQQLNERGMHVALLDVDEERLRETRNGLPDPSRSTMLVADVSDPAQVSSVAARLVDLRDPLTLLVNCAAVLGPWAKPTLAVDADQWRRVFDINVLGPLNCVRAFLPLLEGAGESAVIVNVASISGMVAEGRLGPYAASKHALVSLSETLAIELGDSSLVQVSLACPGGVATNLNRELRESRGPVRTSADHWLTADDVASTILEGVDDGPPPYIFTHPATVPRLQAYFDAVLAAADI